MSRRWIQTGFVPVLLAVVVLAGCEDVLDRFSNRPPDEKLWRKHCAKCHGVDGSGNTPAYMGNSYADLTDNVWKEGGSEYAIRRVVREGVFGEMPGFKQQLTDKELDQLVGYVRKLRSGGSH
jgi:mono/diheme cytochrome c family protein